MAVANSFIFGNINTADYDVVIEGYGNYTAPKRAVEMVSVPGRNGAVVLDLGYYENGSASFVCVIQAFDQDEFAEKVARFRNAIVSQLGYQRLTEGYLPGEYRMAMYSGGLDDEPEFIGRAGKFEVNFNCKPQRWLTSGESAVTVSDGDSFYNPTPFDASPLLMVEGYGTIGFNGYEIEIENAVMGEVELARSTGFPLPAIGTMNYENSIPFDDQLLLEGDEFTISFPYMKWTTNLDGWIFDYPLTLQTLVDSNSDATTTLDGGQLIPTLPHPSPGGSWAGNYNYTTVISPIRFEKGTAKTWSDTVTASNVIAKAGTTGVTENLSFTFDISVIYDGVSPEIKVVRSVSFSDATVIRSRSYHIAHCRYSEITGYSSVSILGDPTYIDCDLGDAYMIKDGSYISLNSYIDLGSDLPVLASGNNPVTIDNTITELKIVPRYWIL